MIGQSLLITINLLAGIVAFSLAMRALRQRHHVASVVFAVLMFCAIGWTLTYSGVQIASTIEAKITFHKLKQACALLLPMLWLIFAAAYTGMYRLRSSTISWLLIVPTISVALALTNEQHNLLYTDPRVEVVAFGIPEFVDTVAPIGVLILLFESGMLVFSVYILIHNFMRVIGTYRTQTRVVLIIALVLFTGAMLEYTPTSPLHDINLLQLSTIISGLLISRYLLPINTVGNTPIAYDAVMNNLPDAMAVLDTRQRVVSVNPSFLLMFGLQESELLNHHLPEKAKALAPLMQRLSDTDRVIDTIVAHEHYIEAACAPIRNKGMDLQGYVILCHDVTLERKAQDTLIDSERRYRALFDNSNDAIFIANIDGSILLANQPACELLGAPLSKLLNKPIASFLKSEDVADMQGQVNRLRAGEMLPIHEQTIVAADGTPIPVETSMTLVKDNAGEALNLQLVVRDIRERKLAEDVIANDRYLLRTLFDNMPDLILTTDRDGHYTMVNQSHLARLGLASADDFLGKTAADFYEADVAQTLMNAAATVMTTGKSTNTEEQRPSGNWYAVTRVPLNDAAGNATGVLIVERDITATKVIHERLERRVGQLTILRQVDEEVAHSLNIESVGIIALDAALRLSRANAGYIALKGHEDDLQVRYLIGGYNRFKMGDILPHDSIAGRAIMQREGQYVPDVRKDTDYVPDVLGTMSVISLPIIVQDRLLGVMTLSCKQLDVFNEENYQFIGLLANRIAIALDNAQLYELTSHQLAEVQSLNETLSALEQIKTDMIRIASHDLKNPLGVIDGYLNMLEMDRNLFDPMYIDYFDSMQRAVERMNKILSDILSLERVQQRATGAYTSLVDMSFLSDRVVDEYGSQAEHKSQTMHMHIKEGTSYVLGDESQLYEAMSNLVSNAIKYTPTKGEITVRFYEDDRLWVFEVEDTGYGIPEDRQARLFEPFYRAKAEGTEKIDGTGLGLHLVKNIVERHQGAMFYRSEYEKGSLFGFRLPPATPEQIEDSQQDKSTDAPDSPIIQRNVPQDVPTFFDD